jgi:hypothetical protein
MSIDKILESGVWYGTVVMSWPMQSGVCHLQLGLKPYFTFINQILSFYHIGFKYFDCNIMKNLEINPNTYLWFSCPCISDPLTVNASLFAVSVSPTSIFAVHNQPHLPITQPRISLSVIVFLLHHFVTGTSK